MRRTDAEAQVQRLATAFPGEMVEGTVEEYIRVLLPMDKPTAGRVIDKAIEESPWRPKVADLIRLARELDRPKSQVIEGIRQLARMRGIPYDEARAATVHQLRINHRDEPQGGWRHHLEALGEAVP